jgi:hypothetical protein
MDGYHTPRAHFLTVLDNDFEDNSVWRCPYCVAVDSDALSHFTTRREVYVHIGESDEGFGAEHDRLKSLDGWYEQSWSMPQRQRVTKRRKSVDDVRGRHFLEKLGVDYSDDIELLNSLPHPTDPRIVFGGPSDLSIPVHLQEYVNYGFSDLSTDLAENYFGLIALGSPMPWAEVPPELEGLVVFDSDI